MTRLQVTIVAAAALLGGAVFAGSASAMPVAGLRAAAAEVPGGVQNVRWVCGPFRCVWRPNWYLSYGYYGAYPRVWWGRPWGFNRRFAWHRW